jgi:hypothetical protein
MPVTNKYYRHDASDEDYIEDGMLLATFARCTRFIVFVESQQFQFPFRCSSMLTTGVQLRRARFVVHEERTCAAAARRYPIAPRSIRYTIGPLVLRVIRPSVVRLE